MIDVNTTANALVKAQKAALYFQEGSSDKVYNVEIKPSGAGYDVCFSYGRRGSTLNFGKKNGGPIDLPAAEVMMTKLLKEKLGKGYLPLNVPTNVAQTVSAPAVAVATELLVTEQEDSGRRCQLLNPVTEAELDSYLDNNVWGAQEKRDGERRMIIIHRGAMRDSVRGINRKGNFVTLPDAVITEAKKLTPASNVTVIDGEIIGDKYYPFDLLMFEGVDYTNKAYALRLAKLEEILDKANTSFVKPVTAHIASTKRAMLAKLKDERAEGVVFKNMDAKWSAGRPNSGGNAMKFKFVESATVRVGSDSRDGKRSVEMLVRDGIKMVSVGFVTIPPNFDVPSFGDLIEVQYLYFYEKGSLYQPVYKGRRTDLEAVDTHASLKRKQDKS